jgi:hypothetical protein
MKKNIVRFFKRFILAMGILSFLFGFLISPWVAGYSDWVEKIKDEMHSQNYFVEISPIYIVQEEGSLSTYTHNLSVNIFSLEVPERNKSIAKLVISRALKAESFDNSRIYNFSFIYNFCPENFNLSDIIWKFRIENNGEKSLENFIFEVTFDKGLVEIMDVQCLKSDVWYDLSIDKKQFRFMPTFLLKRGDVCDIKIKSDYKEVPLIKIKSKNNPKINIDDLNAKYIVLSGDYFDFC